MKHRLTLDTNELIVIREALHTITIKGTDAVLVGGLLEKVYKGIEKAAKEQNTKDDSKKSISSKGAKSSDSKD